MSQLPKWVDAFLFWVAVFVALAAIVDFWLGKGGQKRIQKRLEDWWLRLEYMKFLELGGQEARFCLFVFTAVTGNKFWSIKRFSCSFLIFFIAVAIVLFTTPFKRDNPASHLYRNFDLFISLAIRSLPNPFWNDRVLANYWSSTVMADTRLFLFYFVIPALVGMITISLSISVTSILCYRTFRLSGRFPNIGNAAWVVALILQLYTFNISPYIAYDISGSVSDSYSLISAGDFSFSSYLNILVAIWTDQVPSMKLLFKYGATKLLLVNTLGEWKYQSVEFAIPFVSSCITNGLRLLLLLTFVGSWSARVVLRPVLSTLLLRLVESDKGVLTVVATGMGGTAKLIEEIIKRF